MWFPKFEDLPGSVDLARAIKEGREWNGIVRLREEDVRPAINRAPVPKTTMEKQEVATWE